MTDIEQKIRDRAYQSPSRARAAVSRSQLGKREQARLVTLIDRWESEGTVDHVVAGLPDSVEGLEAELVDVAMGAGPAAPSVEPETNGRAKHLVLAPFVRLNLNARVRVRLTPAGVAGLYAKRSEVVIPENLVQSGGVWETQLWEFMRVFGSGLHIGFADVPTVDNVIDVLDPWAEQPDPPRTSPGGNAQ